MLTLESLEEVEVAGRLVPACLHMYLMYGFREV
jgi:hypothetical protein